MILSGDDLPLRARNDLLVAAGYAPIFQETALAEPIMEGVKTALDFILRQQEPYPALVVDRGWNIVDRNAAAVRLRNAFFDPDKFAAAGAAARNAMKLIFVPLAVPALRRRLGGGRAADRAGLRHEAREGAVGEPAARLLRELLAYPGAPRPDFAAALPPNEPLMTVTLRKGDLRIKYFSTLSTFGTPQDVTLQELRIKSFFPADAESATYFHRWAADDRKAAAVASPAA